MNGIRSGAFSVKSSALAIYYSALLTCTVGACGGGSAPASGGPTPGSATGSTGTSSAAGGSGRASSSSTGGASGSSGAASTSSGSGARDASVGQDASGPPVEAGTCDACASGAIYVSPSGDDANPGTLARPVKTLTAAQTLVRGLNGSMTSDITVYLRGGTYPQTSTLTFANGDSGHGTCGTSGCYVKYLAFPGERPLISGGQPITGWKVYNASKNIYSASGLSSPFRQLYVNGVKAIRARSPNLGTNGAANFYRISGNDNAAHNIQVSTSYVSNWNNFTDVEMHIMIGWGDATLRLASVTTTGNTAYLKVQSTEDAIVFVRPNPALGGQFGGGTKLSMPFTSRTPWRYSTSPASGTSTRQRTSSTTCLVREKT